MIKTPEKTKEEAVGCSVLFGVRCGEEVTVKIKLLDSHFDNLKPWIMATRNPEPGGLPTVMPVNFEVVG